MKFTVIGTYHGEVKATVTADSLLEALKKLDNAEEDCLEILEPSRFEFEQENVRRG
jgi:hypothetical protein